MTTVAARDDPRPATPAGAGPAAAVYERELDVSVERIWENVLDWEHLPFLHSQAFTSIDLVAADADGWRAKVGVPGSPGPGAEVDVKIDRAALRYSSYTVAGAGAGTDIVTTLFPRGERRTGIRVEFHVPWAPQGAAAGIGEFYRQLYVGLWDQDEEMMLERQRLLDGPRAGAASGAECFVGTLPALDDELPCVVDVGGRRFRVARVDGALVAHDTRCPHLGGPLHALPLEGCDAVCPWHGYRFDVRSGRSSDGRSLRLAPAAQVVVDGDGGVRVRLR